MGRPRLDQKAASHGPRAAAQHCDAAAGSRQPSENSTPEPWFCNTYLSQPHLLSGPLPVILVKDCSLAHAAVGQQRTLPPPPPPTAMLAGKDTCQAF